MNPTRRQLAMLAVVVAIVMAATVLARPGQVAPQSRDAALPAALANPPSALANPQAVPAEPSAQAASAAPAEEESGHWPSAGTTGPLDAVAAGNTRLLVPQSSADALSGLPTVASAELARLGVVAIDVAAEELPEVVAHLAERGIEAREDVTFSALRVPTEQTWQEHWVSWPASRIGLPTVWDVTVGSADTVIAVLDSGVTPIPELDGRVLTGKSFVSGHPRLDGFGHGTLVAVAAAGAGDNGIAAAGSCWSCKVLPVKVLDDEGGSGTASAIASGIIWATDNGADVINMSIGGMSPTPELGTAVTYARDRGVVLVAGAGNNGEEPNATAPVYPAAYPGVIGVAGTDDQDRLYEWSSRGPTVDLAAPGCVPSQQNDEIFGMFCGTSASSPLVAGAIAATWSAVPHIPGATMQAAALDSDSGNVPGILSGVFGADTLLSQFGDSLPFGAIDVVERDGPVVTVSGWAIDPDTTDPISVRAHLNGAPRGTYVADVSRPELAVEYPYGPDHGFVIELAAVPIGENTVCIDAINAASTPGSDVGLGCRAVTVHSPEPVGALLSVAVEHRTAKVSGWALDPDTTAPIEVEVTIDGEAPTRHLAADHSADAAEQHPYAGPNHGFDLVFPGLPYGEHEVCVTALNAAGTAGSDVGLGCVTINVSEVVFDFPDVPPGHAFHSEIQWMTGAGISTGYPDGWFRPDEHVSRQAMAAFMQRLYNLLGGPPVVPTTFSDVPAGHPFHAAISWMGGSGISTGYGDGTFRPGDAVSREAMAAFMQRLYELLGGPPVAGFDFPDVSPSHPFHTAISWMGGSGVSSGFADGLFRPHDPVSRQAMAAFMQRLYNLLV